MSKELGRKKHENPYEHIKHKTNDEWFLYWLCEDDEFTRDLENLSEAEHAQPMLNNLLAKYGITEDEYSVVALGLHSQTAFDFPFQVVGREENGDLVVRIPKDIKRAAYLGAWPDVKDWLESDTADNERNRAAENTQLVYAIFKARKNNTSFRKIFELYQRGELNQYSNRSTGQFSSEDSLERYYNKYKPAR